MAIGDSEKWLSVCNIVSRSGFHAFSASSSVSTVTITLAFLTILDADVHVDSFYVSMPRGVADILRCLTHQTYDTINNSIENISNLGNFVPDDLRSRNKNEMSSWESQKP
ncbi:hypothetical protein V1477_004155 [Vespula maculifrons]|uniref:Uncharacterized protein n=1 Tax=Vespula maculifrons TaxID=7453 RepID=A0ABD2CQR8_VESMC